MQRRALSAPTPRKLLATGAAYISHVRRTVYKHTIEEDEAEQARAEARRRALEQNGDENGSDDLGIGDEEESIDLLLLDPKEWKVRWFPLYVKLLYVNFFAETRPLQSSRFIALKIQSHRRADQGDP